MYKNPYGIYFIKTFSFSQTDFIKVELLYINFLRCPGQMFWVSPYGYNFV